MRKSDQTPPKDGGLPGGRNKILWSVLFILIAAATIWAVVSHSKAFSLSSFGAYLAGTSKLWLGLAVLSVLCFIAFEGEALRALCRALGYRPGRGSSFMYAASDIYFSGITPSASGGQPGSAYFMMKEGIPASITTVVLLLNLTLYTLAILVISAVVLVVCPGLFLDFGPISKILIVLGFVFQCLLSFLFIMLLVKGAILHRLCDKVLRFLCRIKLLRHEEEKRKKLQNYMEEYAMCARMMGQHKKAMALAFFWNIMQRVAFISVPLFVYLSAGRGASVAGHIWAVQSYVVIGSNAVPIPGAMGVSDYIMLDGYGNLMPYQDTLNFELLSRSLSFYVCILLCGTLVLLKYLHLKKKGK